MSTIIGQHLEFGFTELIGKDEAVAQNEYSGSVAVALGQTSAGFIDSILLVTRETDGGGIIAQTGVLYIFDADPSITSGASAMSAAAADHKLAIARVDIAANDWNSDATGAAASKYNLFIPFHALSTLYFVYRHTGATTFNDGGTDDEILEFNFWYRRLS